MSHGQSTGTHPDPSAAVDLIGMLAYAKLTASSRLAAEASLAPTLADTVAHGEAAAAEFQRFRRLRARLAEMGADPEQAMQPFVAAFAPYDAQTRPHDWLESLVKMYVGGGAAADFIRGLAAHLDGDTRGLVTEAVDEAVAAELAVTRVRAAIADDPKVAGRLALWARRVVGEELGRAHRVVTERAALAGLVGRPAQQAGDGPRRGDAGETSRAFAGITEGVAKRMSGLGLST